MKFSIYIFLLVSFVKVEVFSQNYNHLENDSIRVLTQYDPELSILRVINDNNKKIGFIDSSGKSIIEIKYDFARDYNQGYAIVSLHERYGLIDQFDNVILPFEFDYILNNQNQRCIAAKDNQYGLVSYQNDTLIPFQYDKLISQENQSFIYSINRSYGLRDISNEYPLSDSITAIKSVKDITFIVRNKSGYDLYDSKSNLILSNYESLSAAKSGTIISKKNGKYGFISKNGKTLSPCVYESAYPYSNGLSLVKLDKKIGFVNSKAEVVIPFIFEKADSFKDSISIVQKQGKYGIINIDGKYRINPEYDNISYDSDEQLIFTEKNEEIRILNTDLSLFCNQIFKGSVSSRWNHYNYSEGLMAVKIDSLWGFINKDCEFEILPKFENVSKFKKGYSEIGIYGEGYGLINKKGKIILPQIYNDIDINYDTLIIAVKGNKSTVLKKDKLLLEDIEGNIETYKKNHLTIRNGANKYQILNLDGEPILPRYFDEIEFQSFAPGISIKENGQWGYFDMETMKISIPLSYEKVSAYYGGGIILIENNGKHGLYGIDRNLPAEYDTIEAMTYGVLIQKEGKMGLLNKRGKTIFDIVYDNLEYIGCNVGGCAKFEGTIGNKVEILEINCKN